MNPISLRAGREVAAQGRDGTCSSGGVRLLRETHIFSSVVRELLALAPLREASGARLTLSQLHVLKLMRRNGHHHIGQVAELLGVSAPAATKTVDKLEALGLVVRSRSEDDRRTTLLAASPRGRRVVRRYEALKRQRLAPVLSAWSEEELEALARHLQRFSLALLAGQIERGGDGACLRCDADVERGCAVARLRGGCPCELPERVRVTPPVAAPATGPQPKSGGEA